MGRISEKGTFLLIAAMIAALVLLGFLSYVAISNSQYNCQTAELFKSSLRIQVKNSEKRLPKIQYYKDHPSELQDAIKGNEELLKTLKPIQCRGIFGGLDSKP